MQDNHPYKDSVNNYVPERQYIGVERHKVWERVLLWAIIALLALGVVGGYRLYLRHQPHPRISVRGDTGCVNYPNCTQ